MSVKKKNSYLREEAKEREILDSIEWEKDGGRLREWGEHNPKSIFNAYTL